MPGTLGKYVYSDLNGIHNALLDNDEIVIRMYKGSSVEELLGEGLDKNNLNLNANSIIHEDRSKDVVNSTRGRLGNTPKNVLGKEGTKTKFRHETPKSRPKLPPYVPGLGNNYYRRGNTWTRVKDSYSSNNDNANANKPNQLSDRNNSENSENENQMRPQPNWKHYSSER